MKKLITLSLILVLVLSLFATSFAATELVPRNLERPARGLVVGPALGGNGGGFQTLSAPPRVAGD